MATTKSTGAKDAFLNYAVYVPLGVAKLAADKAGELADRAVELAKSRRHSAAKTYGDLADRGRKLASGIRRSTYTRRAVDQVRQAGSTIRSAGRTAGKAGAESAAAARATGEAAREAAKKVS